MKPEEREQFMQELYDTGGGDDNAKQLLKEHLAAQGIEWDGEI